MMALALLLMLLFISYVGWFFGRIHEASVEYRVEQMEQDAYSWAACHGRLPAPEVRIRYVDLETGITLEEHEV